MKTLDPRRCCVVAAFMLALGFTATPVSAQCDVGVSAYTDGAAGDYNGDGEAPLHFWGSGIDNSSCPGAYHWYALEVSVKDAYDNTPVFRSGTTEVYDEVVLPPGFYTMSAAFWVNCSIINGNVAFADDQSSPVQVPLPIPTGETITFLSWQQTIRAQWYQNLLPANVAFAGRSVKEFPGGVGLDYCHFPESARDYFSEFPEYVTWPVEGAENFWGPDQTSWALADVTYYQAQNGVTPCEAILPQTMKISEPTRGWVTYLQHAITLTIGVNSVSAQRGNVATESNPN
jgi:hypothetical protein